MSRGAVLAPGHLPSSASRWTLATALLVVAGAASARRMRVLNGIVPQLSHALRNEAAPDIELTEWIKSTDTLMGQFGLCPAHVSWKWNSLPSVQVSNWFEPLP